MHLIFKNGKLAPNITQTSQLVQLCIENVTELQNALLKEYHLDQLKGYAIDEDNGLLRFKLKDDSRIDFEVAPIGVWNANTQQWVWSWANSDNGAILYARAAALRGLSNIIDSTDFTEPVITCDAHRSQMISCMAVEYLGGIGRFVAPQSDFRLHFALMKKHN